MPIELTTAPLSTISILRNILDIPFVYANNKKYEVVVTQSEQLSAVNYVGDNPSVVLTKINTGELKTGALFNGAIRCTASTPSGNVAPYSFFLSGGPGGTIREGGSSGGWFIASTLNGTQRDIKIATTGPSVQWRAWVQDATGYGSDFKFGSLTTVSYP